MQKNQLYELFDENVKNAHFSFVTAHLLWMESLVSGFQYTQNFVL